MEKAHEIQSIEKGEKRKTEIQLLEMQEQLLNLEKKVFQAGFYSDAFQALISRQAR